jgi:transcriptional regulator GlxA family with amidase domain
MRFVIYLPGEFYSGVASSLFEIIQVINQVKNKEVISVEFVAHEKSARSRSGVLFPARPLTNKKIDVLLVLAGLGAGLVPNEDFLDKEALKALPVIKKALKDGAIIGATCGAAYFLAKAAILNGKRATISWWLKRLAAARFPEVRWEPSRMVVRSGRIYTSGGGFSGFELLSAVLIDIGFSKEEKLVRKLMVLPPARTSQAPYEVDSIAGITDSDFIEKLERLVKKYLPELDVELLAKELHVSERTLARKFRDELSISPGKWIQEKRLNKAKMLLESGSSSIDQVCIHIGFEDLSSFSRLFKKTTGMSPTEYKKHFAGVKHRT